MCGVSVCEVPQSGEPAGEEPASADKAWSECGSRGRSVFQSVGFDGVEPASAESAEPECAARAFGVFECAVFECAASECAESASSGSDNGEPIPDAYA